MGFKSKFDQWIRIGTGRLRADTDRKPEQKRRRAEPPVHPVVAPAPSPVSAAPAMTAADLLARTAAAAREAALGVRPRHTSGGGTSSATGTSAAPSISGASSASAATGTSAWLPPILCNWSYTSEAKLTGRVYGKRGYRDGVVMTTSVVPRANRFHTHAITESGTVYLLGQRLTEADAAAEPSESGGARGIFSRTSREERHKEERRNSCRSSDSAVPFECSICREPCQWSETDWDVTPCGHAFHEACLLRWVTHSTEAAICPNCRHPLSSSRLRLFDSKDDKSASGWSTYYMKDNLGINLGGVRATTSNLGGGGGGGSGGGGGRS